uniref:Uncharacterized protein n=1 Tax=Panagrellus redivivus TaxID=6233 RepID=A0A7E4ZRR5_PANRE
MTSARRRRGPISTSIEYASINSQWHNRQLITVYNIANGTGKARLKLENLYILAEILILPVFEAMLSNGVDLNWSFKRFRYCGYLNLGRIVSSIIGRSLRRLHVKCPSRPVNKQNNE